MRGIDLPNMTISSSKNIFLTFPGIYCKILLCENCQLYFIVHIWIVDPAKSEAVSWGDKIDKYYSITSKKLAAFGKARGLVW